jgi:hypothetical protein
MFLFTTSGPATTTPASPVMSAIRNASDRTGVNFDYLVQTAQRESAMDPAAKARTSSATGLFQFIDQTWLATMRQAGPQHGLGEAARAITQGADGRFQVSDPQLRERIMAMRNDPETASVMAAAFTQRNREQLTNVLGREPSGGDLYVAHVLGAKGATDLIQSIRANPERAAVREFPDAAAANRNIFFDRAGRARSVSEVYQVLTASHQAVGGVQAAQAAGTEPPARQGLMGLFSTQGSRAPVSDAVARIWGGGRAKGLQVASADPAQRFFPALDGQMTPPLAEASPTRLVNAPSPPERPADIGAGATRDDGRARGRKPGKPLDLNAFLRPGVQR